jgi:hypothetical protein
MVTTIGVEFCVQNGNDAWFGEDLTCVIYVLISVLRESFNFQPIDTAHRFRPIFANWCVEYRRTVGRLSKKGV